MINNFLTSTKNSIDRYGSLMTYSVITDGQYDIETGSVTNTNINYSVRMYKKHIRANQYNYPNLIGKDSAMFYLVNHKLSFRPKIRDIIIVDSIQYNIESIIEHGIDGKVILYKLLAVRG